MATDEDEKELLLFGMDKFDEEIFDILPFASRVFRLAEHGK
jgi:hypothetical protein